MSASRNGGGGPFVEEFESEDHDTPSPPRPRELFDSAGGGARSRSRSKASAFDGAVVSGDDSADVEEEEGGGEVRAGSSAGARFGAGAGSSRAASRPSSAGGGAGPLAIWTQQDPSGAALTPPSIFRDWFAVADADKDGRLSGKEGAAFLGRYCVGCDLVLL